MKKIWRNKNKIKKDLENQIKNKCNKVSKEKDLHLRMIYKNILIMKLIVYLVEYKIQIQKNHNKNLKKNKKKLFKMKNKKNENQVLIKMEIK